MLVIKRGDRIGIRVKDSDAETRRDFHAIPMYPANAKWRIEAHFEPAHRPRTLAVPNVLGTIDQMPSPGTAVFTVDGKGHRLDPLVEPGENQLFFIFGAEPNKTRTYSRGAFS